MITRRTAIKVFWTLAASSFAGRALAAYPDRPITFVVPYLAGGSPDILARLVAAKMGALLGQPIVVQNKAGAAGTIGGQSVAQAAPDGFTLMIGTDTAVMTGAVKDAQYDGLKDLAPVGLISTSPLCLAVGPGVDAIDLPALIVKIKANPGKLAYASSGVGGVAHLVGELLRRDAGLDMTHIPYKGSAAAVQDVLAGRVPIIISGPTSLVSQPSLRILTTFSDKKSQVLPDVPVAREAGIDIKPIVVFFGLYAPAGTPGEVTAKLRGALEKIVKDPEFGQAIAKFGQVPAEDTTPEYANTLASSINKEMVALFSSI